jgi:raffinose/stachyose/melibiose transport system permease protein
MGKVSKIENLFTYILLIITGLLVLYPILLIFMSSFKTGIDFMGNPVGLPSGITFENYTVAWEEGNFGRYFFNSIFVTMMSVLGITLFGAMAAYGLNRNFKGNQLLFIYFLLGMMIPAQATIIMLFIFLKQIALLNTYLGLILVYIAQSLPLAILIFSGFFKTIPKQLEEAALLDGCSELRTFWVIILPISRPVIATVIILTGLQVWNDFFLPLILILDQDMYTLPVGLLSLRGEFSTNWPAFFAAMNIIAIPIIVIFLFLQKHFIKGLTSGSVKG